jgi:hypothetical protein
MQLIKSLHNGIEQCAIQYVIAMTNPFRAEYCLGPLFRERICVKTRQIRSPVIWTAMNDQLCPNFFFFGEVSVWFVVDEDPLYSGALRSKVVNHSLTIISSETVLKWQSLKAHWTMVVHLTW